MSWLSPNLWIYGSLYGNIRFDFNWEQLVAGRKLYWGEAMKSYRPPAYRILVAKDKPSADLKLEEYPVEDGDGPLYYDKTAHKWYVNGKFTGEFMVDSDLDLLKCKAVGFDLHHKLLCRKDHSRCADLGQRAEDAGAKLLARLIAQKTLHNNKPLQALFLDKNTFNSESNRASMVSARPGVALFAALRFGTRISRPSQYPPRTIMAILQGC